MFGISICFLVAIAQLPTGSLSSIVYIGKPTEKAEYTHMDVMIKLKDGILSTDRLRHGIDQVASNELQLLFYKYGISSIECVFSNRYGEDGKLKSNLADQNPNQLENWQRVKLPSAAEAKSFLADTKFLASVDQAQLDEPFEFKPAVAPNDPDYNLGYQWQLNDPINPTADIDAPEAWNINKGRNDVIVAILDGGVDYNHRDMDPGNRSRVIAGIDTGDKDNDPLDDLPYNDPNSYAGHGTSVAGLVGAITDNNKQVAGVMWNCKIMPVKMVGGGSLTISYPFGSKDWNFSTTAFPGDVANAIDYAVNNGANVINLSYGFHAVGFPIDQVIFRVPLLAQSLDNAYKNNVVTCAAMGNEFATDNSPSYPAAFFEQVVAVGATDRGRARADFSNTGPHISVSAPGVNTYTTERGGGARYFSGTSAASPIAAGVAGLIISQAKDRGFNVTNNDVRHIMELTANDATAPGFDIETGYGIVNANNALQLLAPPNVLYHYTSTGGTATKIRTDSEWILLDGRWGLAAASYFSVDNYKITKHVDYAIPFCSTPKVWVRERESKSLSYANPNSGRPWANISNITTTGFDLDYVAYYVRYDAAGRQINQWVPTDPNGTVVAYTAVGQPNPAAISGPVNSSASPVCSTSQFTLANPQAGTTATWSSSNPSGLSINASTGVATRVNNYNGQVNISATVSGNCGSVPVPPLTVWVGNPPANIGTLIYPTGSRGVNPVSTSPGATYIFNVDPVPYTSSYTWVLPAGFSVLWGSATTVSTSINITTSTAVGSYTLYCKANNDCGSSWTNSLAINNGTGGGGSKCPPGVQPPCKPGPAPLLVYPNPASSTMTVTVADSLATGENGTLDQPYRLALVDRLGTPVFSAQPSGQSVQVPVSQLPAGVYYLNVVYKEAVLQRQVFIVH